jgi:hypothetical protein
MTGQPASAASSASLVTEGYRRAVGKKKIISLRYLD